LARADFRQGDSGSDDFRKVAVTTEVDIYILDAVGFTSYQIM